MNKSLSIITLLFLFAFTAGAQQAGDTKQKSKKQTNQEQTTNEASDDKTDQGASGQETESLGVEDEELLGSDNVEGVKDGSDSYRNERPSGNPNNTSVDEGSNRRSTLSNPSSPEETAPAVNPHSGTGMDVTNPGGTLPADESAPADTSSTNNETSSSDSGNDGSAATGVSGAGDGATNTPSVIQQTASQSGSPSVPVEKGQQDGTNTVQSAKPNMAGSTSRVKGQSVDVDTEIRKGTNQQQSATVSQQPATEGSATTTSEGSSGATTIQKAADEPNRPNLNESADRNIPTQENNNGLDSEMDSDEETSGMPNQPATPAMDQGPNPMMESKDEEVTDKKSRKELRKERRKKRRDRD